MKIVAVNGSNRKGGNTEMIIRLAEKQLMSKVAAAGIHLEFEYIPLGQLSITPCRGCRLCFDRGEEKCPLKDGLPELNHKLLDADGVILASPVYVEDVSGIMKNFIDRMAYHCHRPAFSGKPVLLLATSGQGSTGHALRTMNTALGVWGFHITAQHRFVMGARMGYKEAEERFDKEMLPLTNRLYSAMSRGNSISPSFYSLLVFKVQQRNWLKKADKGTYDYRYWLEKGWLEPSCVYYTEPKSNALKCRAARIAGGIIAAIMR